MPALGNVKWEKFAQLVVGGFPAIDAWAKAGYTGQDPTNASHRLRHKPEIVARINELVAEQAAKDRKDNQEVLQRIQLTREYVIRRLVSNVERAMEAEPVLDKEGNPIGVYKYEGSVANRALELLGKELGMFVDRKEVGVAGEFAAVQTADELRALIIQRLSLGASGPRTIEHSGVEGEVRRKTNRLR